MYQLTRFLSATLACAWVLAAIELRAEPTLIRSIEVSAPLNADDDDGTFWFQARPAAIPEKSTGRESWTPQVLITLQKTDRVGTHMYHGLSALWTDDLGRTWTKPRAILAGDRRLRQGGILETPCDMTPQYHRPSGKVLATGATFWLDPKLRRDIPHGPSDVAYIVYDPPTKTWQPWKTLKLPDDDKFHFARAGCTQRIDLESGEILLPIYFQPKDSGNEHATVLRCKFDGSTLEYIEHGDEMTVESSKGYRGGGLGESSLTKFDDKFYLTMRSPDRAHIAVSDDGLHFSKLQPWKFDDGAELGSYGTQQHWINHSDGLFLAYTRKGANNDKVVRHRAPLLIARVDPERLVVERATEQVLLPNLGEAFGNFGVCNVTPEETWVVDCLRLAKPGAGNVYLAKIRWAKPNTNN